MNECTCRDCRRHEYLETQLRKALAEVSELRKTLQNVRVARDEAIGEVAELREELQNVRIARVAELREELDRVAKRDADSREKPFDVGPWVRHGDTCERHDRWGLVATVSPVGWLAFRDGHVIAKGSAISQAGMRMADSALLADGRFLG